MATIKTRYPTKRFGTRYGKTTRERFAKMEILSKKKYKCPYCSKDKIKRKASGIWECKKCGVRFTGRAYEIGKKKLKEEIEESDVVSTEDKNSEAEEEKNEDEK